MTANSTASAPHIYATMLARVVAAVSALSASGTLPPSLDTSRVVVEPPRDASHGDMATNAAMVLARDAGKKPREVAEAIAERLRADDLVEKVDVAGPGFINITLKASAWTAALAAAIAAGTQYGRSQVGQGTKVNVEYVSANPTGPMHVGHCRGAVFGDALASLLAFVGFDVSREYYINDAGAQVDVLARSAYLRYREALGEVITIPEGLYPGDYLVPVGQKLAHDHGRTLLTQDEAQWLPLVRAATITMMMAAIRDDLAALNIDFDVFFSERSLIVGKSDQVAAAINFLRDAGDVYRGPAAAAEGARRWRTTRTANKPCSGRPPIGDDVDRPLLKSDGSLHLLRLRHRLSQGPSSIAGFAQHGRRLGRRSRRLHQADAGGNQAAVTAGKGAISTSRSSSSSSF